MSPGKEFSLACLHEEKYYITQDIFFYSYNRSVGLLSMEPGISHRTPGTILLEFFELPTRHDHRYPADSCHAPVCRLLCLYRVAVFVRGHSPAQDVCRGPGKDAENTKLLTVAAVGPFGMRLVTPRFSRASQTHPGCHMHNTVTVHLDLTPQARRVPGLLPGSTLSLGFLCKCSNLAEPLVFRETPRLPFLGSRTWIPRR